MLNQCKRKFRPELEKSSVCSKVAHYVREEQVLKDGTTQVKVSIKTDYLVPRHFKPTDFSIQSIIAAGATDLLRPIGLIELGLDSVEDFASRLNDSNV